MKRRWGKPITQVQRFVPEEYCDGCFKIITDAPNWRKTYGWSQSYSYQYIDMNGNGIYDSGEMFSVNSGMSVSGGIASSGPSTVNVYGRYSTIFVLFSTEYTNPPTGTPGYTTANDFHQTNSFTIKIVNNIAYYLPAGTNAS